MATSKKPRKKHDKNANIKRQSDRICRNSLVLSVIGLGNDGTEWIKNNIPQDRTTSTEQDFELMYNKSRPWSFVFGVICRDQLGRGYIKFEYQSLANQFAFTAPEMTDYVNDNINAILNDVNEEHVLSPFLIASPEKKEFTDDYIKRLLTWKKVETTLKTPFEIKALREEGMAALREIDPTDYTDKATWTILRKNGCNDFADMRLVGLEKYQHCKGIGKKRIQSLIDGYHALINDEKLIPKLTALREFETQIYIHQQTMARLNRAAQM